MHESATVTHHRAVTTAAGVYAPGHLGELTQYLPFELVDDVLAATGTVQRRLRLLPSRVGVYFVLALTLFPGLGYARVWGKLVAGLAGLNLARPSEKALRDVRRRLGVAPFEALFNVVAGPLAQPRTPGVRYRGMRTVAFDGINSLKAPDTERNRGWMGRVRYSLGFAGYPTARVMALVETGTRGLLGAAIGSQDARDEAKLAMRLLGLLRPGMLVLADRAFDNNRFIRRVHATGAHLLIRSKATRRPPVLAHLPDGSCLSCLEGVNVRIIEADLYVTGADGTRIGDTYLLITTLLDHDIHPAVDLIRLYHERWEIESAFLSLRHTLLHAHVLRSGDRVGVEQEIWALLTTYQLLRTAMVTAVETRPGTDPDRAGFTTALQCAREQIVTAQGIRPTGPVDLLGAIGTAVLADLLPQRRARYSARKVKSATSRYLARSDDPRPRTTTTVAAVEVAIRLLPLSTGSCRAQRVLHGPLPAPTPRPLTRRDRVTTIMATDPTRSWSGRQLAELLQVPVRSLLTQLGQWTGAGWMIRTGTGTYTLPPDQPGPRPDLPSSARQDPPTPPDRPGPEQVRAHQGLPPSRPNSRERGEGQRGAPAGASRGRTTLTSDAVTATITAAEEGPTTPTRHHRRQTPEPVG